MTAHSSKGTAVLLDAGNVLVLPEPAVLIADVRPSERWDAVPYLVHVRQDRFHIKVPVDRLYYEVGASKERVDAYLDAYRARHGDPAVWTRTPPGARELIWAARAAGRKVGVVSNTAVPMTEAVLRAAQCCQVGPGEGALVDGIFDSSVVGLKKPDPRIFWHALNALGCPREEAVHVGDSLEDDIVGALRSGVTPIHLDPFGICEQSHDHLHVKELLDVLEIIGKPSVPPVDPVNGTVEPR